MSQGIDIVFGCAGIGSEPFADETSINQVLEVLAKAGRKIKLDTAQLYGDSEEWLGKVKAGDRFEIDTKAIGGFGPPEASTREGIVKNAKESIRKLGVKQVDIFYIHAPPKDTLLAETLAGIQELYELGLFKRFGLSNFKAAGVQEVYDHCKAHSYVLPTVYQGNYSPVARLQETVLFPTLRKLGLSFYAYSPLAGGFLTKTKQQIQEGGIGGRFDPKSSFTLYRELYGKPAYLEALEGWEAVSKDAGVGKAELAYRWVAFNSVLKIEHGDALIVGASRLEQLEQTLGWLKKGPLNKDTCEQIDQIWKTVEHEAPLDNFNH